MTRTVLVTGGGTGIGLAVATRFAADGHAVIVTGRRPGPVTAAADKIGGTALICDAADPAQWVAALPSLPDRIDVLVNNAGGNTDFATAAPTDLAGVERAWRANLSANLLSNLLSAVLATGAVADRIADGGAVVHLGSIAADRGPVPTVPPRPRWPRGTSIWPANSARAASPPTWSAPATSATPSSSGTPSPTAAGTR
jgi:3-oxoacyl-[acyl-carrier protein] reductase